MIFDFHLHFPFGRSGSPKWKDEDFLDMMDSAGVAKGVIFTIDGFYTERYEVENEGLCEAAERQPERWVPFCSVNPKQGKAAIKEAIRCFEQLRMPGMKLHPWIQGFHPICKEMEEICEIAGHYRAPILFHDGTPPNSYPLIIGWLAEKHPETTFILGHGGLFDLWQEAAVVVNRHANVYVCVCGTAPEGIFRKVVETVPSDRVLFGTDAGLSRDTYMAQFRTRIVKQMPLEESLRRKWLYENADILLARSGIRSTK
ncbi:amidohydrolase family protein [Paenibacillus solisilvae]|uniref:Amidohydrolase family protein n=1 Tax=Paenibacillus solisilvae TaxID=2486751 RepID=A0ABW0W0C1_9BACL